MHVPIASFARAPKLKYGLALAASTMAVGLRRVSFRHTQLPRRLYFLVFP